MNGTQQPLSAWIDANRQQGAAGTEYMTLLWTNVSDKPVEVFEYPIVSGRDLNGSQVGPDARTITTYGHHWHVVVHPGQTVSANLLYSDAEVGSFPNPVQLGSLNVLLPQSVSHCYFSELGTTHGVYLGVTQIVKGLNGPVGT